MSQSFDSFDDFALSAPLRQALADVGYESPSPIQSACIPVLLEGHDLLGEAQTGTGKTAAFALPVLERLDLSQCRPQALVLTPTRELAIQVAEAFQRYARHLSGFHVLPVYGGQGMGLQLRQLRRGTHVIVGTPGRVMDHLERRSLDLGALRTLVLDEADEMLRMGFIDDVEWILQHTPATRQTALFSATMAAPIRRVAHTHMRSPREVKIAAKTATVPSIRQYFWQVSGTNKLDALTRILDAGEELDAALVFVRTKTATAEIAERLEARGFAAAALNGDMSQILRERVIEQLKNGSLDIVVATDVAARGIDVPRISHVFNYDIPYDTEAYIHRIGRTGRAGRTGNAILFVAPREYRMLRLIERATRQPIEALQLPSRAAIADRRIRQFCDRVAEVMQSEDLEFFTAIVNRIETENEGELPRIAAALALLAQRDKPLRPEREVNSPQAPRTLTERVAGKARADARDHDRGGDRKRHAEHFEPVGELLPFRIAVGRNAGATPREIVGAIANEAGISSRHIGRIDIRDEYSIVELPADLPPSLLGTLARVRVKHCMLEIRPWDSAGQAAAPPRERKRPPRHQRDPSFRSRRDEAEHIETPDSGEPPAKQRKTRIARDDDKSAKRRGSKSPRGNDGHSPPRKAPRAARRGGSGPG